jgi:hypothetical protein
MNARRSFLLVSALAMGAATSVAAQSPGTMAAARRADSTAASRRADTTSSLACPRSGASVQLWTGAAGDSVSRSAGMPRVGSARGILDTVITLNITDRTWQRDSLSAGVSLGAAGIAGRRRAPWHACAGATVTLGRVTATLHNVHGQIRLRADPAALDAIGGSSGSTPPAPPRR